MPKANGSIRNEHRLAARPDESDQHSSAYLLSRTLQRAARFGLDRSDQITDMDVAIELVLFVARQLTLLSSI